MRVAVLGAGIMGSCLALQLARRGAEVVVVDAADAPLAGASRWNEGKIHLGYLYAGDPSLASARHVMEGGLSFVPLMSELLGGKLTDVTEGEDLYLIHVESIVSPDQAQAYYQRVAELVRQHPRARDYLVDVSSASVRPMARAQLSAVSDDAGIVAGFACPERSVSTVRIADALVAAMAADPRIELRLSSRVLGVEECDDGRWRFRTDAGWSERFHYVINALWHGRIDIDRTAGLEPPATWSHRFRVAAFVRTAKPLTHPSAVVAVGPFGDVKNYNDRDFYLSWYPSGLLAETVNAPPPLPRIADVPEHAQAIAAGLSPALPWVGDIFSAASEIRIEGGYVFAAGMGALSDPSSTIHRRDGFGVSRRGNYVSVDTGKYSSAPLLALRIADALYHAS